MKKMLWWNRGTYQVPWWHIDVECDFVSARLTLVIFHRVTFQVQSSFLILRLNHTVNQILRFSWNSTVNLVPVLSLDLNCHWGSGSETVVCCSETRWLPLIFPTCQEPFTAHRDGPHGKARAQTTYNLWFGSYSRRVIFMSSLIPGIDKVVTDFQTAEPILFSESPIDVHEIEHRSRTITWIASEIRWPLMYKSGVMDWRCTITYGIRIIS